MGIAQRDPRFGGPYPDFEHEQPQLTDNPTTGDPEDWHEPVGLRRLEIDYPAPESLALNDNIVWNLVMKQASTTMSLGKDKDAALLYMPSQDLGYDLIRTITAEQKLAGHALFFETLRQHAGYDQADRFSAFLLRFVAKCQRYWEVFDSSRPEERLELQEDLLDDVYLMKHAGEGSLDSVLDRRRMGHEGGDMSDIHPDLRRDFILPFYQEKIHGGVPAPREKPSGYTGQVYKRLILEGKHMFLTEIEVDPVIDLRKSAQVNKEATA